MSNLNIFLDYQILVYLFQIENNTYKGKHKLALTELRKKAEKRGGFANVQLFEHRCIRRQPGHNLILVFIPVLLENLNAFHIAHDAHIHYVRYSQSPIVRLVDQTLTDLPVWRTVEKEEIEEFFVCHV